MTPLELGVFNDIVERVENHAKYGAYVRVRIKNVGNRIVRTPALTVRERHPQNRPWTEEEFTLLRTLYTDPDVTLIDIAERLDRSEDAISVQASRLGLVRPLGRHRTMPWQHRSNGSLAAARRLREARAKQMQEERMTV